MELHVYAVICENNEPSVGSLENVEVFDNEEEAYQTALKYARDLEEDANVLENYYTSYAPGDFWVGKSVVVHSWDFELNSIYVIYT